MVKVTAPLLLSASMVMAVNQITEDLTKNVTVEIDGKKTEYTTMQGNVGDLLKEAKLSLSIKDYINRPYTDLLTKKDNIVIRHNMHVTIIDKGVATKLETNVETVRDLLAKEYISVRPLDRMSLAGNTVLKDGTTLKITRVDVVNDSKKEAVAFKTETVDDSNLDKGIEKVKQEGVNGEKTISLKKTYEDGKLIKTEVTGEKITKNPVNKIISVGTKEQVVYTSAQEASGAVGGSPSSFTLTFYTDLASENGGYTGTASGAPLVYGVVASNSYPFGTKIYLEGYGYFTVADRGGSDFDSYGRLDVFIPRNAGESDDEYYNRVNSMGRPTVSGYVY